MPSFRPDIYYLNPFVDRSDPSHWKVGNPDLEPEISQLLSMSYRFYTEKTSLAFQQSINIRVMPYILMTTRMKQERLSLLTGI